MKQVAAIPNKIFTLASLQQQVAAWRVTGQSVAFTNGVFDLLHEGHIFSLCQAATQADKLIVGLNSDASVKQIKGPQRPLNHQEARAIVLASLVMVDAVVIFNEDTPLHLIKAILPDVLIKGGDYSPENIVGAAEVLANGGRIEINKLVPDISTTGIIQKMRQQL